MELFTSRLKLTTINLEFLNAIELKDENFLNKLGYKTNWEWPEQDYLEAIPYFKKLLIKNGSSQGYDTWLVLDRFTNEILGATGFINSPDETGTIEIGFGINFSKRGQGYCVEAVKALICWAAAQNGVKQIIAKCELTNLASRRVLEKLNFSVTEQKDNLLYWKHNI